MFDADKAMDDQKAKIEKMLSLQFDPDKSVINYRFVVNDAMCHPWEPMPEAGRTLSSLVEWLKQCTNCHDLLGERWDYRRLSYGGSFSKHIVSYGLRSQFYIPEAPKEENFVWSNQEDLSVTCCGQTLNATESYDSTSVCPDAGYIFVCERCGKHTRRHNGKLHRSVRDAFDAWNKIFVTKENN